MLLQNDIPQEIVEALSPDAKACIAQALTDNAEKVSISNSKLVVDNLAEIEAFMSYTDEELIGMGIATEKVQEYRNSFSAMYNMTDADLALKYDFSPVDSKLFRKAYDAGLSKDIALQANPSKCEITTSGTIASSEMTYSTIAIDGSYSSKPVYYTVNCAYSWTSPFSIALFNDCIAAVWGGFLHESNITGMSAYYYAPFNSWEGLYCYQSMSLSDQTPNQHFLMSFPQAVDAKKVRSGSLVFNLSSNTKQGNSSYVITRYGHQRISWTSPSITWGFPSVSFGTAYDQTPVESGRYAITY